MTLLQSEGFEIISAVFSGDEIEALRIEVDRIANEAGEACVRHLRSKSEMLDKLANSAKLLDLLPTGYAPVRSILFNKTKEQNWPVAWHQDLTIAVEAQCEVDGYGPWSIKDEVVHVQPPQSLLESMITVRIHLDDTPAQNGALRVIPQSSRLGKIPSNALQRYSAGQETVCECHAGDVLLMSPLILHASSRSVSVGQRRVIHFEYALAGVLAPQLAWHESLN